jgi:ATP-dependent Lon protease
MAARKESKTSSTAKARTPVLPVRDNVHFPGIIQTLLIGREVSLKALQTAMKRERMAIVLCQRDQQVDEPRANDLHKVGTLSEVLHVLPLPDGTMRVVLRGTDRVHIDKIALRSGSFNSEYSLIDPEGEEEPNLDALMRECSALFQNATSLGLQAPPEVLETITAIEDPGHLADMIAQHLPAPLSAKQDLLEENHVARRLERLLHALYKEKQVLEIQASLRNKVEQELGETQKEYFLREQLKVIREELGDKDEALSEEGTEYRRKIYDLAIPEETQEKLMTEVRRLERAPSSSPEGMVIRNYLDWMVSLPWNRTSVDEIDVKEAGKILDRDHFGLDKVKNRILDFLAVRQLNAELRGPILCFVGPPGVGKTSIGRSIAESIGRQFVRISLGGVRDEAEIRGHRRTYIGSMPGRLIQSLKQCGTRNPVFMLDEIDKLSSDLRGDPTSALLEALDPEQNNQFSDHYIESPFNLSDVMFIATANLLENIPPALRDRMEIITFPSYVEQEKIAIAERYLIPKKLKEHGLKKSQLKIPEKTLEKLVREYTRESGVRSLEREIATLCRKAARRIAEGEQKTVTVGKENIDEMLGKPHFRYGLRGEQDEVGAATGLVYTEYGGDIVTIEVNLMEPVSDEPKVKLTGRLGDVMQESAHAAHTYLRARQSDFKKNGKFRHDIHIHVPEGAVPKDGPSAGVTMLTAMVSAFSGQPVRRDVAMTGEITLRGKVLPVGGIREKVLAAHRAGIGNVILPEENMRDLDDLPPEIRKRLSFHPATTVADVLKVALNTRPS